MESSKHRNPAAKRIAEFGEKWGDLVYDLQKGDKSSPKLQRQKRHYSEQMGRTFVACSAIYVLPIFYFLLQHYLDIVRHPDMPNTLIYDLIYTVPSFSYSFYGALTVFVGSLYLTPDLYDNYLAEEAKEGEILAVIHSGILFLFTGISFQISSDIDMYLSLSLPILFIISIWIFREEIKKEAQAYVQLQLDSPRCRKDD